MLKHYEINKFGKAVLVRMHPRVTPKGSLTLVHEFERTEPKSLKHLHSMSDVQRAMDRLAGALEEFTPKRELVEGSVKHYFGNFLTPIYNAVQLKDAGYWDKAKYDSFIAKKQSEFIDLFGKVKEAIKMERIVPYSGRQGIYEILQSRRISYGI